MDATALFVDVCLTDIALIGHQQAVLQALVTADLLQR